MRLINEKTQIEIYSEILEDEVIVFLECEGYIENDSFAHEFGTENLPDYVVIEESKILNTNLSEDVYKEIKHRLDEGYHDEELASNIETELEIN